MKKSFFNGSRNAVIQGYTILIILAAVGLLLAIILAGPSLKSWIKGTSCASLGGVCADKIVGNEGKFNCPKQAGGFYYEAAPIATCEKDKQKIQCCKKLSAVDKSVPVEELYPDDRIAQQKAKDNIEKTKLLDEANKLDDSTVQGDTLQYLEYKKIIQDYQTENFFDSYRGMQKYYNAIVNKEVPPLPPMDSTLIKAYISIYDNMKILNNKNEIESPLRPSCIIESMLLKTYLEGYWYYPSELKEDSFYIIKNKSVYIPRDEWPKKYADHIFPPILAYSMSKYDSHLKDGGEAIPQCAIISNLIKEYSDDTYGFEDSAGLQTSLDACRQKIIVDQGIVDADSQECQEFKAFLENNQLSPGSSPEWNNDLLMQTDALMQPLINQYG